MRGRWLAAAGGVTAILLAGACGSLPEGVDGELTNGWGEFAEPVGFVPDAEVCHTEGFAPQVSLAEYDPVSCERRHLVETGYVGAFADEAAQLDAPPAEGSDALRAAYRDCEEQVEEYLGADFRHGRLWLGVATPSQAGWDGGARWFRCDLMELESVYGQPTERDASLAGSLAGDSALRLGCFAVEADGDDGEVEEMTPVGCDEPHESEFVGAWDAPDGPYLDAADDSAESQVYEGCRERIAAHVDVPVDGDLIYRTGAIADWMSELDWEVGDRAFRCYLWLPDRELTESLAGAGTDALPVRTE